MIGVSSVRFSIAVLVYAFAVQAQSRSTANTDFPDRVDSTRSDQAQSVLEDSIKQHDAAASKTVVGESLLMAGKDSSTAIDSIQQSDDLDAATQRIDTLEDIGHFFNETPDGFVITRAQILRSDAASLGELLELLPGFHVNRNRFLGGAEEIQWYGLHIIGLTVTVDGVEYISRDLRWQGLPRWSPGSFREIRVSRCGEKYGGHHLLIELKTMNRSGTIPATNAFWQTGPFRTNLLDVLFSRQLSRSVCFYLHTRSLQVESKEYDHPDVITTFYESMGKDSIRIMRQGYNPEQIVREIRAGFRKDLGRWGKLFADHSSFKEEDTVFTLDTGVVSYVPGSKVGYTWKSVHLDHGYLSLGVTRVASPLGSWEARYTQRSNKEKSLQVRDSIGAYGTSMEVAMQKVLHDTAVTYGSPVSMWVQANGRYGPLALTGLQYFRKCPENSSLSRASRLHGQLDLGVLFLGSSLGYSVAFPQHELTYMGIPIRLLRTQLDTVADFSARTGLRWRQFCLWTQYSALIRNGVSHLVVSDTAFVEPWQAFTFGLYTRQKSWVQLGSYTTLTNGMQGRQQNFWFLVRRPAVRRRLQYELMLSADYLAASQVLNLESKEWQSTLSFWDVSLKLAIQIRSFRLFYKVANLTDARRLYYAPYELPGLHFNWGIHWTLSR